MMIWDGSMAWYKNNKRYRVGDQPIIIESGVAIFLLISIFGRLG